MAAVRHRLPGDLDRHGPRRRRSGGHPTTLVSMRTPSSSSTRAIDVGLVAEHVGQQRRAVLHRGRVDLAPARGRAPLDGRAQAARADLAGEPERLAAVHAPRQHQAPLAGGLPERGAGLGDRGLQPGRAGAARLGPSRPRSPGGLGAQHQGATCTTAPCPTRGPRRSRLLRPGGHRTRRAAGAPPRRSGTCRTCRGGCRTARRRWCSWAASRPGPVRPSATNAPPSPLAQKPRSSRCNRAVMVKLS